MKHPIIQIGIHQLHPIILTHHPMYMMQGWIRIQRETTRQTPKGQSGSRQIIRTKQIQSNKTERTSNDKDIEQPAAVSPRSRPRPGDTAPPPARTSTSLSIKPNWHNKVKLQNDSKLVSSSVCNSCPHRRHPVEAEKISLIRTLIFSTPSSSSFAFGFCPKC